MLVGSTTGAIQSLRVGLDTGLGFSVAYPILTNGDSHVARHRIVSDVIGMPISHYYDAGQCSVNDRQGKPHFV